MEIEQGLFASILEHPDDITLRLIYADWCDERGDPRGEFIRIQCELAIAQGPPIKYRDLRQREMELLTAHLRAWNGEIHRRLSKTSLANRVDSRRGLVRRWEYHRGFVEFAVVEARAVVEHSESLSQIGPLRRLKILRPQDCLKELLQSPFLRRLDQVELNLPNLPSETALREIRVYTRSLPASVRITPTQFRSTLRMSRILRPQNTVVLEAFDQALPGLVGLVGLGLGAILILLSMGLGVLLEGLVEFVYLRLRLVDLF